MLSNSGNSALSANSSHSGNSANSSHSSNSANSSHSGNSANSANSQNQEKFLGLSRKHRCFRCRRFYGRCKCTRRMYRHYRSGCMCRMILKGMLVVLVIYLISKVMNSYESIETKNFFRLERA